MLKLFVSGIFIAAIALFIPMNKVDLKFSILVLGFGILSFPITLYLALFIHEIPMNEFLWINYSSWHVKLGHLASLAFIASGIILLFKTVLRKQAN